MNKYSYIKISDSVLWNTEYYWLFPSPFSEIYSDFSSHFRKHQLAFCDTIIQRNNRVKFASSEPTLEAYFPFDPYLLKR